MANNSPFFVLRADQYKNNPAEWFVPPPVDISGLDFGGHSIRLIGSRGCGKTMLFRSIAEQPLGKSLTGSSADTNKKIRVYIRPDNQLMNSFKGWGISQEVWDVASQELILLRIFREIANKINNWLISMGDKEFLKISNNRFSFSNDGESLQEWIRLALYDLYRWSRNPNDTPPVKVATLDSLYSLLATLPSHYHLFPKDFSVAIYIDELEIYQNNQQKQINDWIKNPPTGWVFHVAHRRYLDYTRNTSSNEKIEESNDYKIIDLDAPLINSEPEGKRARKEFYSRIVLNEVGADDRGNAIDVANALLPEMGIKEVCDELRNQNRSKESWERLVKKALINNADNKILDISNLIEMGNSIEDSRWWAFWPVLVARNKMHFIEAVNNESSRQLLANNLLGSVLQIYIESNGRVPLSAYSGFGRICSIVLSNVREFMLIVREAIENERVSQGMVDDSEVIKYGVSFDNQTKAIQNRSRSFSVFVSISAHKLGFDIQQALDNWYFYLNSLQALSNLPYNEPNHFVLSDPAEEDSSTWKTLNAGERHGAFIFEKPTKLRKDRREGQLDIRLHPLICIWKYLSYRKRNASSPLKFSEIKRITDASGTDEVKSFFLEKYSKKDKPTNLNLF